MRLGPDDSRHLAELPEKAGYIARAIGPSVVLAKCYELLGQDEHARETAKDALEPTCDIVRRSQARRPPDALDRLVRAMYLADLAGRRALLSSLSNEFIGSAKAARDSDRATLSAGLLIAARVVRVEASGVPDRNDLASDLANALAGAPSSDRLRSARLRIRNQIRLAEEDGQLRPWSDAWDYIVAARLASLLGDERK